MAPVPLQSTVSYIHDRQDDEVFRRVFSLLYGTGGPIARLGDIIHWRAGVESLGLGGLSLNSAMAFVPNGYFYRAYTPAPSAAEIAKAHQEAAEWEAAWTLYPAVRDQDDTRALTAAGFMALPWFIEAEYRVRDNLDTDLRAQLGASRHREILRLVRRADEQFVTTMTQGREALIDVGALESFDRLHQLNLAKYGHGTNHFSAAILRILIDSPLGPQLCVIQRRRHDGATVQAVLALVDDGNATVHLLVHGIDHARVPPGQNLYATSLYEIFRWGLQRGIATFNLGRGAEHVKLNLGANVFHVLANHLARVCVQVRRESRADAELISLREVARRRFDMTCDQLRETANRRGARDRVCIPLPRRGLA